MPVPFVFRVRGVVRGVTFVSDGSALVRADLVVAIPDAAGVREVPSETLEALLQVPQGACATPLDALVASRVQAGVFRTGDAVALADRYVWLAGSLGRAIVLRSSGLTSPVVVCEGTQVLGTIMPMRAADEPADTPVAATSAAVGTRSQQTFGTREVLLTAQHFGLLGEFDGGTWARLLTRVIGPAGPSTPLDEERTRELLVAARAAHHGAAHTGGPLAEREGIFALDQSRPASREDVIAAVRALAASHGVADVVLDGPLEIGAIHEALGGALARAGSPLRAYLVGTSAPFVLIRETLAPLGPFAPARAFAPTAPRLTASLDPQAFLKAFAGAIAGPQARVEQLASMDVAPTPVSPPHAVHVLRRTALSGGAESFFLVTTGFSARPLAPAGAPADALRLLELTTWTSRYDDRLAATLSQVGVIAHALAREGARLELGHAIATDETGFMGWPRVLLSRFLPPIALPIGRIDVARVTPITNEEWATKQRLGLDVLGGEPFVRGLEAKGIPALLGRWYSPPR